MSLYSNQVPNWLKKPPKGFLTAGQIEMLDRLFEGILPSDPSRHIPGAPDARASDFVSQLLAMGADTYWEIPAWGQLYKDGLAALDHYARGKYQAPLVKLNNSEIHEVLAGLEAGLLSNLTLDQKLFFTTMRRHCIQGCFADPRWGGNKDRIMWRAIGYLQQAEDVYP
jgi:gluconate 2-dehydrogenase gamma chain